MNTLPKVAVITFHRNDNYGALLQCYALQEVLKEQGTKPLVIDYRCRVIEHPLSLEALQARGIRACLMSFVGVLMRLPRHHKFEKFRLNLTFTEPVDKNSIRNLGDRYDYYITGSDNVWNADISGLDPNYFLTFVKHPFKRKSYAASFGGDKIPLKQKERYQTFLDGIDIFLMREEVGVKLVEELTNKTARVVLDPTLLIERDQWERLVIPLFLKKKYILVYQLVPSSNFVKAANQLAKRTGHRLIFMSFPLGGIGKGRWRLSDGPQEWLSLIKNAEYILTDSFHGCVFSVLFHKQFSVMVSQLGARIVNLLKLVDMENRIIDIGTELPQPYVDYSRVDEILKKNRADSIGLLRNTLGMV